MARLIDFEYNDKCDLIAVTVEDDGDVAVFDRVQYGEWINPFINKYGHPCHCCSKCGFEASQQDKNYCPNCGVNMI